ncbi:MAG: AGE family epimerase/isomerase [Victivallaceae bacterium]|nr:AGE family epimerase/isomerase [Victivallaceae bacterium]
MIPESLLFVPEYGDLAGMKETLERAAEKSIEFWTAPRIVDRENGCYHVWFDRDGREMAPETGSDGRSIINTLRVMYVHSMRLAGQPDDRRTAAQLEHGLASLEPFRTPAGWLNWIHWDGSVITREMRGKRWFHSEADSISTIYLLYIASDIFTRYRDGRFLALAQEAFALLERSAWDGESGGYFNTMDPETRTDFSKDAGQNMHMALALSRFCKISDDPSARRRLEWLLAKLPMLVNAHDIAWNRVDREWKTPEFPDWGPHSGADVPPRILAGHDVELVWYLEDAAAALNAAYPEPLLRLGRKLTALTDDRGYFATWCSVEGVAEPPKGMIWWSQFEAMICFSRLWKRTGDEAYLKLFWRIAKFTFAELMNPENGVFRGGVDFESGRLAPQGGWAWKGGLHTVRALTECAKLMN